MLASLSAALLLAQARPDVFGAFGKYDPAVPKPSAILGYEIGERHTTYFKQQRVIEMITNAAKSRTRYFEYGQTAEGRPLRVVVISAPENIARLEEIRKANERLAHGENNAELKRNSPVVVWINENIHGDEAASFEAGMQLIYNLAASQSPQITNLLKNAVVVVNPCYNPDGHERYVIYQNSISTGSPDPASPEHRTPFSVNGRTNHYRFDMNRDRISFSQQETRAEVQEVLRWNPQVYCDQHGEVETYFFPPTAMAVHEFFDRERYNKWTDIFGRATAGAFDKHGWNYFIKDTFDFYFPGYLDTSATLTGAIGMTHETDAAEVALTDPDGFVRTLWGGAAKHFTSALAVIGSAVKNREALLDAYGSFKAKVVNGEWAGKSRYLTAVSKEAAKIERFADNLRADGIRVKTGYGAVNVEGESLWKDGAKFDGNAYYLTLDLAQPQGAAAKMLCTNTNTFEEEFVKKQLKNKEEGEGGEFYDMTAWSLPLLHDVRAWWTQAPANVRDMGKPAARPRGPGEIGYAIRPGEEGAKLVAKLLMRSFRISFTSRDIMVDGQTLPIGTCLVFKGRNDEGYEKTVMSLDSQGVAVPLNTGYPDSGRYGAGSSNIERLRPLKIGILFGDDSSPTPFGSTWFMFEKQLGLPFTPLTNSGLRGNLDRFSVIVAPGGRITPNDDVKKWISDGGCLILFGGSSSNGGFFSMSSKSAGGSIPGALALAKIDLNSWLAYGSEDDTVAVPVDGGTFPTFDGAAIKVAEAPGNILHGWSWPDATEKGVAGTAFAAVTSSGRGSVVWFAEDPSERAMRPGLLPFVWNALVYGARL